MAKSDGGCPKCGSQELTYRKDARAGGLVTVKITCTKCLKLIGYSDGDIEKTTQVTAAPATPPADTLPEPDHWLFVSRRLDLIEVPNEPMWRVPAFTQGNPPVPYFRVTPQVVAWLDAMGAIMERDVLAGKTPRETLDDFCDHMQPVWRFASLYLDGDLIHAERQLSPSLPTTPDGPR